VVWVRLKKPQATTAMEFVTLLPIVIPPVVMGAGLGSLEQSAPSWMVRDVFNRPLTGLVPFYVVLAMPFTYRAIDTGVRAMDLHTLVDASRNLGASWPSTLLYNTFAVEMVNLRLQSQVGVSVALSMFTLVLTFLMLFLLSFLAQRRRGGGAARVF
jgi:putative spermidine/putrescine transport system permease protein